MSECMYVEIENVQFLRFLCFRAHFWTFSVVWDFFQKILVNNSCNFQHFFATYSALRVVCVCVCFCQHVYALLALCIVGSSFVENFRFMSSGTFITLDITMKNRSCVAKYAT